jgi:hypothetical protein
MTERERRQTTRLVPLVVTVAVWSVTQTGPWPLEVWWLPILLAVSVFAARVVVGGEA